ncbi:MAG: discoidin domain-containing protein [Ruminococcaceae bacterium]|nr:discoidin domain-containing protein [Oscillospiraceae bacterium]
MKRLLTCLIAFVLVLSVFTLSLYGCESGEQSSEDQTSTAESVTEESEPMIINNDPAYSNITLGKSYTLSGLHPNNDSPSYPDENNSSMTDGVCPAETAKYSDTTYAGFNKISRSYVEKGYAAVTVDLGGIFYVDKFVATVGSSYHLDVGITAPEMMSVYISNDGKEWFRAGTAQCEDITDKSAVDITLSLNGAMTARYVEYRFLGNGNWIMVAEVEAFGIPAKEAIAYPEQKDSVSFLFVGNSSTYYFNTPNKFQLICEAAGIDIEVYYCCVGGAYLREYADANNESCGKLLRQKLAERSYDYIVLQDNSNADYNESKPALDIIMPLIKENGAIPLLYKRYSSNDVPANRPASALKHHLNYTALAKDFAIDKVAPVADAFLICEKKYPNAPLFFTDNSHHSNAGSYLIACVWAITYFDIDITNISYTAGLDSETLAAMIDCAKLACEQGYDFPEQ